MKIPDPVHIIDRKAVEIGGPARILIVSDIHVPYHDPNAIRAAIAFARKRGRITHIVVNGDLLDAHHLSNFEKDPHARHLRDEVEDAAKILAVFRDAFPRAQMIVKNGNHEARFDRYVRTSAPQLEGIPGVSLAEILGRYVPGVLWVEEWRSIMAGDLLIVHGHEVGRGSGGYSPARWLLQKTGHPSICGHFHRTDIHRTRNAVGTVVTAWTVGALCNLSPDYHPRNQWNHGAAIVDLEEDGTFDVENRIL